jgi:tetratricopeptide (TPR) repeat protein
MAVFTNELDLGYSAAGADSLDKFDRALTAYLGSRTDVMDILDGLIAADPQMFMAQVFRGYLLKLAGHPQFNPALAKLVSGLEGMARQQSVTPREKVHLQVLKMWIADQGDSALAALETLLEQYPLDMLALRIAHYLHFYKGSGEGMCASTGRVLQAWPKTHGHFPYLQGMHAFGLEESAQYDQALQFGQAAVEQNQADIWATHAVAHVYQMLGDYRTGLDWLRQSEPHWRDTNNFRYHVIWHEALYWLGLDEPAQALRIYDQQLAASIADDFYLDVCNNAALLWRLEFLGVDVGARWQPLVEICSRHVNDRELVFANLHYLIPLAVTGADEVTSAVQNLADWAATDTDQGQVCQNVGLQLAQGLANAPATPATAVDTLFEVQSEMYHIGGSKAQRDVFRLLTRHVAERANRADVVAALI